MGGLYSRSGCGGKEKNPFELNPQSPSPSTLLTKLFQLSCIIINL